jgi:ankyrin repeat protein
MKAVKKWQRNRIILLLLLPFLLCLLMTGCRDRESYKKEIGQKGIVYSEGSFLNAVKEGDRHVAELFIKSGMDVNVKGTDGSAALLVAAEKGDLAMARLLLQYSADVNIRDIGGYTALMYAAYQGNIAFTKLLMEHGPDIHAKDKDGWTALKYAFMNQHKDVADLLIKAGAKKK